MKKEGGGREKSKQLRSGTKCGGEVGEVGLCNKGGGSIQD